MGGYNSQFNIACHDLRSLAIMPRHEFIDAEWRHFSGDLRRAACRVESRDPLYPNLSPREIVPKGLDADSERRGDPNPGHDYTALIKIHIQSLVRSNKSDALCPPKPKLLLIT